MSSVTVRIDPSSHRALREVAERSGESMQDVLSHAVEEYRRKHFLESANRAYAALRKQPRAWNEEKTERKKWDRTSRDGQQDK